MDYSKLLPYLKTIYSKGEIVDLSDRKDRIISQFKKDTEMQGDSQKIVMATGLASYSPDFATAMNAGSTAQAKAVFITAKYLYVVTTISNSLVRASQNNEQAFKKLLKVQSEKALQSARIAASRSVWSDSNLTLGTISVVGTGSNGLTTSQIQLSDGAQVSSLSIGQQLNFVDASGNLITTTGTPSIVAMADRVNGVLTLSSTIASFSSSIVANCKAIIAGGFGMGVNGIPAWIPAASPTPGENFNGLDRSVDPIYLAGLRYVAQSGESYQDSFIKACNQLGQLGDGTNPPNVLAVSYADKAKIDIELGAKIVRVEQTEGEVGFEKTMVNGVDGPVEVVAVAHLASGAGYLLCTDVWTMHSIGKFPDLLAAGLLLPNSDDLQIRAGGYYEFSTSAPGRNARIQFAS
jgi:hypothetical protein